MDRRPNKNVVIVDSRGRPNAALQRFLEPNTRYTVMKSATGEITLVPHGGGAGVPAMVGSPWPTSPMKAVRK